MKEIQTMQKETEKTILSEVLDKSEMLKTLHGREIEELSVTNSWKGAPKYIYITLADEEQKDK